MFCNKCGNEINNPEVMFCPKCGNGLASQPELPLDSIQRKILLVSAGQKYPVLRWLAVFYKISAVLVAVFGLITSLGSCAPMPAAYGMFAGHMMFVGLLIFLGSIACAINLWALGEGIIVFLDMEQTLRKIADKE